MRGTIPGRTGERARLGHARGAMDKCENREIERGRRGDNCINSERILERERKKDMGTQYGFAGALSALLSLSI